MKTFLFGTAGIPLSTNPRNTEEGIKHVRVLGLEAMELAFVRQVHISQEKAPSIKAIAKKEGVLLTAHAPYYINLNAREPEKRTASVERILNAARALSACGGWSVCFHAGFYLGMEHATVYEQMKEAIQIIADTVKQEDLKVWIRPEIGGKTTSWGSLEEILQISEDVDGVLPCIDWAHLHARSLGKNNSYPEFTEILESIEHSLGREAITNMHCHVAGIEIGKTGERYHKTLEDSDLAYRDLMKACKDFSVKGVIISESPSIEADAQLLQRTYRAV